MTEFRPADPWSDPTWDEFVQSSPDGWAWGLSGWQRLIERVPEWNLKPLSFDMWENGERVALMPLHLTRDGTAASSGWGWNGPMLAAGLEATRRKSVLSRLLRETERRALEAGANRVALGTPPVTQVNLAATRGVNPFFEFGYEDTSTNSLVLDVTASEETLWSALSANARQEIRKAERLGYHAEQVPWTDYLDLYYETHALTYQRSGIAPHPRAYFDGIAREMGPSGAAILWAGRDPAGRPCAFHNDAVFGPGTLYHTGCSSENALASGVNYLVMWTSILGARARGGTCYEVGDVFYAAHNSKQAGLTRFKSKFGGELHRSYKAYKQLVPLHVTEAPATSPYTVQSTRLLSLLHRLRSATKGVS